MLSPRACAAPGRTVPVLCGERTGTELFLQRDVLFPSSWDVYAHGLCLLPPSVCFCNSSSPALPLPSLCEQDLPFAHSLAPLSGSKALTVVQASGLPLGLHCQAL